MAFRFSRIAEKLSADVRKRWFGTHFFNPPRYMKLLEIIATPESDPAAVETVARFCDRQLGKTVVPANDVQNFIANRVGPFSMLNTFKIMQEQALTIEEIDSLTGQVIGFPENRHFPADGHGWRRCRRQCRTQFSGKRDRRASGCKAARYDFAADGTEVAGRQERQGFYKKEVGQDRKEVRLVLDPVNFTYRPADEVKLTALDEAKSAKTLGAKLKAMLSGDSTPDKAAKFYWKMLRELWTYAANRIGEVSETPVDNDRAMSAGFNWETGPFAMCDAVGVEYVVAKMRAMGQVVPAGVEKLLAAGGTSWYRAEGKEYFEVKTSSYKTIPSDPELRPISAYKRQMAFPLPTAAFRWSTWGMASAALSRTRR